MKRTLLTLLAFALAAVVIGFLAAWAGLVPVAASAGHWPVTRWFLHFTMQQSVETRALGIEVPELDDAALVLRGAGHYESGCAPCHGAPGRPRSVIVRQMTPEPPYLPPQIPEWEPNELFWIVRHGIKFSAMPAWPALQRVDEVWAMVAFLQHLPDLSPAEYRRLAWGEPAAGAEVAANRLRELGDPLDRALDSCARCHGLDGLGRGAGAFPKLAGQTETYLWASLRAYAAGERHSGIMQPIAAGLSEETMRTLARYYGERPPSPLVPSASVDPELFRRGEAIARTGIPSQGVPACIQCHGPKAGPRASIFPVLADQYPEYLALQLELFQAGRRGGTPFAHIMRTIALRLTPEQIRAVALYYGSLGAAEW